MLFSSGESKVFGMGWDSLDFLCSCLDIDTVHSENYKEGCRLSVGWLVSFCSTDDRGADCPARSFVFVKKLLLKYTLQNHKYFKKSTPK